MIAVSFISFQSTLPARGATYHLARMAGVKFISIHAPRTGSDDVALLVAKADTNFNPRSPHGERLVIANSREKQLKFQSTLPARGATELQRFVEPLLQFQSTLPARGATEATIRELRKRAISIHAPRTGSDPAHVHDLTGEATFQSTLPARGATYPDVIFDVPHDEFQSTLPARGATSTTKAKCQSARYFNPRSPHGERHEQSGILLSPLPFQSTLPARGATTPRRADPCGWSNFNPRSPHGERRANTPR